MKKLIFMSLLFSYQLKPCDFNELLKCNLPKINVAQLCNVEKELQLYEAALKDESNYSGVPTLDGWIDQGYEYPHINPVHQRLLDAVKPLTVESVCELGAGCGKISKYIFAQKPHIKLTCVEHDSTHLAQINENFKTRTHIIAPDISVEANIIKGSLHNLPMIAPESFDLVFTCTVMMHLPFIVAVKAAEEIVRISKRYILHVENKNQGGDWYSMTIVKPATMSQANLVGIDYPRLYENLGVKTLIYYEYQDPASPATGVVYLGEKISQ
ncbi:MAG: class I SAM-dependent methyltransferase [Candidatus Dependentiae bacterium]